MIDILSHKSYSLPVEVGIERDVGSWARGGTDRTLRVGVGLGYGVFSLAGKLYIEYIVVRW